MKVEYRSNNSGGDWWLTDEDWKALEKAGWRVDWIKDSKHKFYTGDRHLGALATTADREGLTMQEAVLEWEKITGEISTDAGCACCGQPHYFTLYDDDGKCVESGPNVDYSCTW